MYTRMKRFIFYFFFALALCPISTLSAQDERKVETAQNEQSVLTLTVVGDTVRIQNAVSGSLIEIYNILGVKVNSLRVDSSDKVISLNLPKGYYIFKIGNMVRKVVIK